MILRRLTLPTMLLCSSAAFAQTSVQMYGSLDAGIYSKQLAGSSRVQTVNSIGITTSHWGIRGTEDLGGGHAAVFELSSFVRVDSGEVTRGVPNEPFFSRFSYVGLRGPWGMVRAGRLSDPSFVSAASFGPYAGSSAFGPYVMHTYAGGQPMLTGLAASDSAWGNSIVYSTPAFAGLTAQLAAGLREGGTAGRRAAVSLRYDNGPFSASGTYTKVSDAALVNPRTASDPAGAPYVVNEVRAAQVAAMYDFRAVKLFVQHMNTDLGVNALSEISLRTTQVGASVPMGSGSWLLSWGHTRREQATVIDKTRSTVALGYDYSLSKRTDVYAVALSDRVTGLSKGTGFAVGVRHNF